MKEFIKINTRDNVVIALKNYKKDESITLDGDSLTLLEDISKGHKIALGNIGKDENVIKYGMPIGHAITSIKKGEWIHTHNTKTNLKDLNNYVYTPEFQNRVLDLEE